MAGSVFGRRAGSAAGHAVLATLGWSASSAVPNHREEDPIPAVAHGQDEGIEFWMRRGPAVELLNARDARVRGRIGQDAAALEDIVGDDQRARTREGDGP